MKRSLANLDGHDIDNLTGVWQTEQNGQKDAVRIVSFWHVCRDGETCGRNFKFLVAWRTAKISWFSIFFISCSVVSLVLLVMMELI